MDEFLGDARSTPGRLDELRAPPKRRRKERASDRPGLAVTGVEAVTVSDEKEGVEPTEKGEAESEEEGGAGDEEEDRQAVGDPARPFTCSEGCRQEEVDSLIYTQGSHNIYFASSRASSNSGFSYSG